MFTYEDNVGLLVLKMIGLQDLRWDIHGTGARDGGDAQKVQHKYGSGAGSWSLVDPPHNVRWDIDGTGAGDGVDPQRYNTNNDLDPALPPHDRSWDTDGIGAKDGVDFKLKWKSYNPNMNLELDPDMELNPSQQLTSVWYSYGDKTLDDSSYKKCIIGTSATYICHTHEKV